MTRRGDSPLRSPRGRTGRKFPRSSLPPSRGRGSGRLRGAGGGSARPPGRAGGRRRSLTARRRPRAEAQRQPQPERGGQRPPPRRREGTAAARLLAMTHLLPAAGIRGAAAAAACNERAAPRRRLAAARGCAPAPRGAPAAASAPRGAVSGPAPPPGAPPPLRLGGTQAGGPADARRHSRARLCPTCAGGGGQPQRAPARPQGARRCGTGRHRRRAHAWLPRGSDPEGVAERAAAGKRHPGGSSRSEIHRHAAVSQTLSHGYGGGGCFLPPPTERRARGISPLPAGSNHGVFWAGKDGTATDRPTHAGCQWNSTPMDWKSA